MARLNNKPTPETDSVTLGADVWNSFEGEIIALSRRLERERDEVRDENAKLINDMILHEKMASVFQDERDEAREQRDRLAAEHGRSLAEIMDERDEAREELEKSKRGHNSCAGTRDRWMEESSRLRDQLDKAREKIERQAERIRHLEGATNHATGTPLSKMREQRDNAIDDYESAALLASRMQEQRDRLAEALKKLMAIIGPADDPAWVNYDQIEDAWQSGNAALAAVEGGNHE